MPARSPTSAVLPQVSAAAQVVNSVFSFPAAIDGGEGNGVSEWSRLEETGQGKGFQRRFNGIAPISVCCGGQVAPDLWRCLRRGDKELVHARAALFPLQLDPTEIRAPAGLKGTALPLHRCSGTPLRPRTASRGRPCGPVEVGPTTGFYGSSQSGVLYMYSLSLG